MLPIEQCTVCGIAHSGVAFGVCTRPSCMRSRIATQYQMIAAQEHTLAVVNTRVQALEQIVTRILRDLAEQEGAHVS